MVKAIRVEAHVSEYVDVDIQLDELEDDELLACVEEARSRGLIGKLTKSRRDRIALVYENLVAGRTSRALLDFEAAMFSEDDAGLLDAWQSLREGKWSAAICQIDSEVYRDTPRAKGTMTAPTAPASAKDSVNHV